MVRIKVLSVLSVYKSIGHQSAAGKERKRGWKFRCFLLGFESRFPLQSFSLKSLAFLSYAFFYNIFTKKTDSNHPNIWINCTKSIGPIRSIYQTLVSCWFSLSFLYHLLRFKTVAIHRTCTMARVCMWMGMCLCLDGFGCVCVFVYLCKRQLCAWFHALFDFCRCNPIIALIPGELFKTFAHQQNDDGDQPFSSESINISLRGVFTMTYTLW